MYNLYNYLFYVLSSVLSPSIFKLVEQKFQVYNTLTTFPVFRVFLSLSLSTARKDEEKKQPATMLRSSWAFKNSPFFAPETDEGSNRPLRHLAELQCSMSGRDLNGIPVLFR